MTIKLNKKDIINLLPHREPMLLIDELVDIKKLHSATAIMNVKKDGFYVNGHFPGQPVMPGVLIVEAMAQTAGCLVVESLGKQSEGKLVYFMSIENARFRKPVVPGDQLIINVEKTRERGNVFKFDGKVYVEEVVVAEASFSAMIVDK